MKKINLFILGFLFAFSFSKAVVNSAATGSNKSGAFPPPPIVYVNNAAVGLNTGTSWADAYTDLQTAITNISAGEIWVAQGTYYPGASGNNAATFLLKNNVVIYGGFNGTESLSSQRNFVLNPTVLSGDLDLSLSYSANDAYHVVSTGNTDNTAVLDGFRITGGNAVGAGADGKGGGIFCMPSSPGGGIGSTIVNCDIMQNSAIYGGGIGMLCTITQTLNHQFINCRIHNNAALSLGGGFYNEAGNSSSAHTNPTFVSCIFFGNSTAGSGASISASAVSGGYCETKVVNCTFTDEVGQDIDFARNGATQADFEIYNSILYGLQFGTDDIFTADHNLGAGPFSGTNNYNLDPMFVNAGAADFHVLCTSPAINTGNNSFAMGGSDAEGNPRIQESTIDMGAFESNYGGPPSVIPNASAYDVCDGSQLTLYGSGPGGVVYTWSHGVTDNIPFTPTATETYTMTGTAPNGCVSTETVTISHHTLPAVSGSATDPTICEGSQTTLNGSGAGTYLWDNGVSDGIPFTPSGTGFHTYNVTGTDAFGCVSMPYPVFVYVESNVGFTAGVDADVCTNMIFVSLSGNVGTSTSFTWTTLGTGSFANDNTTVPDYYFSGADMSLDTVRIVLSATYTVCPATDDTLKLAIKNPPMASAVGATGVCADMAGSIPYSGIASNYSSIYWSSLTGSGTFAPDQVSLSGSYAADVSEISSGSVTLRFIAYSTSPGCANDTDDVQITIHSLPVLTPTSDYTICQSDSIYLNEPVTGGTPPYSYVWKTGPPIAIISTSNNQYYWPGQTDTYDLQVTDINGCQAVDTFMVTFDPSNDISGTVNVGAGQLTAGTIYLIKFIPQQMTFDTIFFFNLSGSGAYFFPTTAHGDYLIKVVPDTVLFPNLLPTYYGNTFQWDSATVVTHNCSTDFTADINMIALLGGTGSGTIEGNIIEDVGYNGRYGHNNDHIMVPGGPLKGIDVKLGKNPAGGIQARTMTDSTGHYAFNDLPDDSYRIYVDIPGLPMDSFYVVNIDAVNNNYVQLDYYADSNSVYPILPTAVGLKPQLSAANGIRVFPNPAKENTNVRFELSGSGTALIELMDVTGKSVLHIRLNNLPKGKHEYQLNLQQQQLNAGIYMLQVKTVEGIGMQKVVIE